jgi:hypothetical protein
MESVFDNGGIIGKKNSEYSGVWNLYSLPSISAATYEYIGFTSGYATDAGSLAQISYPTGTEVGDLVVVTVGIDDNAFNFKTSISGWTTIHTSRYQSTYGTVLTSTTLASPPTLLQNNDSNAWIAFVFRNTNVDVTNAQDITEVLSSPSNPTTMNISGETTDEIIVFAGAGGKRAILDVLINSITAGFDQKEQVSQGTGLAAREFGFVRLTGGTYANQLIYFDQDDLNDWEAIAFYLKA